MSYPDSVQYLYALGNELKAGAKFGLERMQILMTALNEPQLATRTVHVAGTNGKGSTSAMIASALRAAGYKTGLYTSPHLISPTERIQIDSVAITPADFDAAFQQVHAVAERLVESGEMDAHPSYFETITAMAFVYFQTRCQWSVIEVGLGGRLDATNVVQPELCVITPIAFDHEAYLGNTIEAIAAEKAGILKPGVPVVVAPQSREAERVILDRAQALECPVIRVNETTSADVTAYGSSFELDGIRYSHSLPGRHQITNATTAILACRRLGLEAQRTRLRPAKEEKNSPALSAGRLAPCPSCACSLEEPAIQQGLAEARWPGRLQFLSRSPDLVVDGAHNPAGAAALADYIREFHAGRPVWIVYGAMRDKAIDEVASALFPLADRLIVTAPAFPRALRPEAILAMHPHANSTIAETVPEAISIAQAAPTNAIVFFTGSLFLVGEVLAAI